MSLPPEITDLAGPLLDHCLIYQTGSHMYGLNTPESDTDWTLIYHDPCDRQRIFPRHPDVRHSAGNDHKLYSLAKFATLIAKGNPSGAELAAHLTPSFTGQRVVRFHEADVIEGFMQAVRPHLVTRALAAAYLGHLTGIQKEMATKGITPKRLSHAIRMADSATALLLSRRVPDYRAMPGRELALSVKQGQTPPEQAARLLTDLEREAGEIYADVKDSLPDGTQLKEVINEFFLALP